ncbi:MAG: malto-oligosyltrehalose trehalohydrolase [Alphaproteobacteria bacterium]|nr:malto-oligosyltrehalose trehalohydrolase [Alphaproteobacteria bacterium]
MTASARFGAELQESGVTFRLWAPAAKRVEVMLDRAYPMQAGPDGWHEVMIPRAGAGTLYKYRIDGELEIPDPASHFQPQDVFGPSEVVDHNRFEWRTNEWRGRPWQDASIVELHVGTFTPGGTFRAAIDKLEHLRETGLTAIELMPIADFAGRRNWGYDGVLLYAPDSAYGRPDDLRMLVDEAHARGLMVFLDVVYNHFGPEGNYLHRYAPAFFASAHTPWGHAIDYRVPQVRAFAIENAVHWLKHYRFDGLRLDAVHALVETGEPSVLHDLSRAVGHFAATSGRLIHLVLENDDNRASLLDPLRDPPHGKYRAQWNDDYHHAWHRLLTGEASGYYQDYGPDPRRHLARALASGFAYQGEQSPHRHDRTRGEASGSLSPLAFVNFLQNHDQIGNRPLGDRLAAHVSEAALTAALAVTLLAPMPPLLFMGEELGSSQPFPFFCDFQGALADAVRKGRREEFKAAYAELGRTIPDPLAEATFRMAVLDWRAPATAGGRERLALVRDLLAIRQREIVPRLVGASFATARLEAALLIADWSLGDGDTLRLLANLSDAEAARPCNFHPLRPIWGAEPGRLLPAWSVSWSVGAG